MKAKCEWAAALLATAFVAAASAADKNPNIVVIRDDDIGRSLLKSNRTPL